MLQKQFVYLPTEIVYSSYYEYTAMTEQIAEYFKTQPVLKAWLFGSFARGEQTAIWGFNWGISLIITIFISPL